MRIIAAHLYALRLPFKSPFSHKLMTRASSDSIIVKLTADSGESGFGEAVPRPYVTGETVSTCLEHIQQILLPRISSRDFGLPDANGEMRDLLSGINNLLPDQEEGTVVVFHAARAAVEIALIDLLLTHIGKSMGSLIPPVADSVTYSAVIAADSVGAAKKIALKCGEQGIKQIKIKVGTGDDYGRVAAVRDALGDSVSLRVDANCAFDVKGALALISSILPLQIASIEQPVPRGDLDALAAVKWNSPIPVMADESLITEGDASELITRNACDLFNLRISKNGGIYKTLRLAEMARKAGIGFQLGCQVGETAILSAAGRHVAAHLKDAKFVEGSYGTLLLEEDIAPVQWGYAGKASLLSGSGLGIQVREDILEKYAETTAKVEMD